MIMQSPLRSIYNHNSASNHTPYLQQFERPMRILMTTGAMGGVWTYTVELARALSRKHHKVTIATMGASLSQNQCREVKQIPGAELFESQFKLEWMDDPWQDVDQAGEWLLRLEKQVQPDLVHLNEYVHGSLPWKSPTLMVGHSCILSWWQAVKGEPVPEVWEQYKQRVKAGLQTVDLVLAPTQAMLTALETHYGPLPNGRVIYNGRNPDLFVKGEKERFIFTTSRVWDEAKNVLVLEKVASRLPWPVYMAGEDKHPNGDSVPLSHIQLLGQLSFKEVLPWFARAPIYALPARYEPFGLSALEAALSGCALVLGDIPSLREVWGDAALFVPPDDMEALEVALVLLIIDPVYRQIMAHRAYEQAQKFTSEKMINNYLSSYRALVREYQAV
jgi:glycogen synthase